MIGKATAGATRLGFIGLGRMGGNMARNLARAGYDIKVFDLAAEKIAACLQIAGAAESRGAAAKSAADAVAHGEVVLTSLPSSAVFVQVAEKDLLPNARRGQIFMDMGTTEGAPTRRLAAAFAEKGAMLLDCPVSGGAATGTSRIFVGGDRDAFDRVEPVLTVLGHPDHVVHCGPSSSGQAVKAVNQLGMGLVRAAYLEAVAFGVRCGVDPAAIARGVGGEEPWRSEINRTIERAADERGAYQTVKGPELPYFLREARERGFRIPLTEALHAFCEDGPKSWKDNMGRPECSFWHKLIGM